MPAAGDSGPPQLDKPIHELARREPEAAGAAAASLVVSRASRASSSPLIVRTTATSPSHRIATSSVSPPASSLLHLVPRDSTANAAVAAAAAAAATAPATAERSVDALAGSSDAEAALHLYRTAHTAYQAGQLEQSRELCRQVLAASPQHADAYLLLAAVAYQQRDMNEAIRCNIEAIKLVPYFVEAYGNLGNCYKEQGLLALAKQAYLSAVSLRPAFVDAWNNLANVELSLCELDAAFEHFQRALALNPNLPDAYSNLAIVYKLKGFPDMARKCYTEALRVDPNFAIAWSNLAGVEYEQGNIHAALAYYRRAIELAPGFADAYLNLGNILKEQRDLTGARHCYETAIQLNPAFATAYANLGSVYYDLRELDSCIAMYRRAIQLHPAFPDALNNLGNALKDSGKQMEAYHCYVQALQAQPTHFHAYNNLGNTLKDLHDHAGALRCYNVALSINPNFAAAYSNLGGLLREQGRTVEALPYYDRAIACDPAFVDAYTSRGNALQELGRNAEAIESYRKALELRPDFAEAWSNIGASYKECHMYTESISCHRKALELKSDLPDALANLVHALHIVCDWRERGSLFARLFALVTKQLDEGNVSCVQPFHALVYPLSPQQMKRIALSYGTRIREAAAVIQCPPLTVMPPLPLPPSERLRIGYVSSDFAHHPLSHLMQSVFGMHDRLRFHVTCFALTASDGSEYRARIEREADHFVCLAGVPIAAAAELINQQGIHVLVNLNGYTKGARNEIFALKPSPVQVHYLGFPGTIGAPDYIQYLVTDKTVVPPSQLDQYAEKMLWMPNCYFVNDYAQSMRHLLTKPPPTRQSLGLPEDKFVFCNFNQLYKITPTCFDAWSDILHAVPNSVLWLLRFPAAGEQRILQEAADRGLASDRILFTDVAPKEDHIARAACADLFLDTMLCNAHTTGCDAMWGGVPVVTVPGDRFAGRVCASLCHAAGMSELVATSIDEYKAIAVRLGNNPAEAEALRKRLLTARTTCALFDTRRWVRNFEAALRAAWRRYEANLAPDHIDVLEESPAAASFPTASSSSTTTTRSSPHSVAD